MSPIWWVLVGIAGWTVVGLAVFAIIEDRFREALGQFFLALLVGPVLMLRPLITGHLPRAMKLSPDALKRFASLIDGHFPGPSSIWLFGYRGRGVIVVRRREDRGWINDVPNSAARVRREARREAQR